MEDREEAAAPASPRDAIIQAIRAKDRGETEADPADAEIVERVAADEPRKVKLRVDHQDVEITEEQRDAFARQHMAAENRLTEASALKRQAAAERAETARLLAEAQALRDNTSVRADSTSSQRTDAPNADTARGAPPKAHAELFRDMAEKLQVGDVEEGAEALASLFQALSPQQQAQSPEEIADFVLAEAERRAADKVVGDNFASAHQEIVGDNVLLGATINRLHESVVEDLRSIGCDPKFLEIARSDLEKAKVLHDDFRLTQGYALRDPAVLVDLAAREIESRYVPGKREPQQLQPTQSDRMQNRAEEKRGLSQPRRVSVVDRQSGPTERRTAGSIVDQMRKARQFA